MKHEIPALTAEQREYISAECRRLIAESEVAGAGYRTVAKGLVAQIALAALTAEVKAYSDFEELAFANDKSDMWPEPLCNGADIALYTTPPVPVMQAVKLPKKFGYGARCVGQSEKEIADKRDGLWLEAIRAAGAEVEE